MTKKPAFARMALRWPKLVASTPKMGVPTTPASLLKKPQ
jgi:hypothetical protein